MLSHKTMNTNNHVHWQYVFGMFICLTELIMYCFMNVFYNCMYVYYVSFCIITLYTSVFISTKFSIILRAFLILIKILYEAAILYQL